TARPVEMMSPDLRVLGAADGLPPLPDTEYLLCSDPGTQNELAQAIFKSMQTYQNPWQYNQFTPEGGDDSLIVEGDFE
ncbi:transcriptional regulator LrhA, partial [Citrobacter freundii]